MPREVFANEIEAFLGRLDAVSAARVVANEAGEVERIYVTTESSRDDASIRRAVTSALMSQYNLPVDGWRVQVAHLEPSEPEPVPECRLVRLEETITGNGTRVSVELRYERDGVQKTASGTAQAPPGQAHRMRAVAQAAVDALRPVLERSGSRPTLEALNFVPFAGTTVALAAVSLAFEHASALRVGAEAVAGSEAEAVVQAVLGAVGKAPRPAAPPGARPSRQRQFEGLRRHYERLIRTAEGVPPQPEPHRAEPPHVAPAPEDIIQSMAEIRPEREGGAPIAMREEMREHEGPAAKAPPRQSMEDAFYRRLVTAGVPVHIRCRDGYEIHTAIVREYGTYSLLVEVDGVQELVFKHGIIAIRPYGPLPPESLTPPS